MSFDAQRERMVQEQLQARGVTDPRLLAAFRKVPRHLFVPPEFQEQAYTDHPLPIGAGQTISQPYMVALMTGRLGLQGHERVLEIGAGSGYQAAILAELALEVFSVERIPDLLRSAAGRLSALGYLNVHFTAGNGSLGWPAHAPYDAIVVTAAAPDIPAPLLAQLADGGTLVLPIGPQEGQVLVEVRKRRGIVTQQEIASCVFVPLVGRYGWPPELEEPGPA
ncbi:MAG: protein-L-isoaspartate(D-aspartate) O-methyltransferase [Candidatus Omnitrophica bacterium]|nr:protein-L-isoaspartate(D-aspartate) O-methyltransferase [Candidatus Omnitrophota bacterium]